MCLVKNTIFVLVMFEINGGIFISSQLDESIIQLKLFTELDMNDPFEINKNNIPEAPIHADCPIEILIHGWRGSSDSDWLTKMKDRLLEVGCNNVIVVDWGQLADSPYAAAVSNVSITGEYIGKVLISLANKKGVQMEKIRIRGFSLGGHVAGFIGKTIISETGTKVGRITGLDPAGPSFRLVAPKLRLAKDDALFTDIIHTDGRKLGTTRAIGNVDFYPNGGSFQSCSLIPFLINTCSHNRAHEYFTESIQSEKFIATACNSYKSFQNGRCSDGRKVIMGYHLDTNVKSGKYYLMTNSYPPYARG
ncbi:phospholipase A1 VesT1.02-like [Chrysoperla carnea]|uniref:phospholipase A1 VesT1.02-like n=1 Tax=Chrysoperla carnea TaxID=189513 RepID=UPI001D090A1A|nr:phospholipase A1 VesT1.02-like [Chrysoperla carnea]